MNSNDTLQPGQQAAGNSKPLWAAVGILGVAVLGMGATMIYKERSPEPATTVAALTTPAPVVTAPALKPQTLAADDLVEKPTQVVQPAPVPAPVKKVVKHVPKPVPAPAPQPELTYSPAPAPYVAPHVAAYPAAPQYVAAPQCVMCGSVESVTPVSRAVKAPAVGVGSIAGGLLGAVLGNQVGHGNGRAAATVLGAVGGGFAGNAIEGNMHKETYYQVGVRMEDGSRRTLEVSHAPNVGSSVVVEGNGFRTRDGAVYSR